MLITAVCFLLLIIPWYGRFGPYPAGIVILVSRYGAVVRVLTSSNMVQVRLYVAGFNLLFVLTMLLELFSAFSGFSPPPPPPPPPKKANITKNKKQTAVIKKLLNLHLF